MKDTVLAKELLNAVWEEDCQRVKAALNEGADPSWIFNGYPILIHAIYLENWALASLLLQYGAKQRGEALGFALENGIGNMVWPLAYLGIVPANMRVNKNFGIYPARFAPTSIAY